MVLKREKCARIIQSAARRFIQRQEYQKDVDDIVTIQNLWRSRMARKEYRGLKVMRTSVTRAKRKSYSGSALRRVNRAAGFLRSPFPLVFSSCVPVLFGIAHAVLRGFAPYPVLPGTYFAQQWVLDLNFKSPLVCVQAATRDMGALKEKQRGLENKLMELQNRLDTALSENAKLRETSRKNEYVRNPLAARFSRSPDQS